MSIVRSRESPYQRGFFKEKFYESFFGTLETVRNREVSVPRGSTVNPNLESMCFSLFCQNNLA